MESSQPARLGAWLGQVGGKSAPEVKRTSPPGNSTVPSRLAQSRCSVNGVEGRGGAGLLPVAPQLSVGRWVSLRDSPGTGTSQNVFGKLWDLTQRP